MSDPITVMIVDDHEMVRRGASGYLEAQPDIEVVAEAESGEEAVRLAREHVPHVVLMDLVMPGMDGVEATRKVKDVSPRSQIIVLTSYHQDEHIFPALGCESGGACRGDPPRSAGGGYPSPQGGSEGDPGFSRRRSRSEQSVHRADRARAGRDQVDRPRPHKSQDRRGACDQRGYRQGTRQQHPQQTAPRRPHTGGGLCLARRHRPARVGPSGPISAPACLWYGRPPCLQRGTRPPCWSHPFQAECLTIAPFSPGRSPAPGGARNLPRTCKPQTLRLDLLVV